ncbi:MAG: glycosyltransferase [Lachnospiraceae bacterium]|nr:glycosyltransferase [Lachnospiraceae bacterium]
MGRRSTREDFVRKRIRILQFTVAASKGGRTQYILNLWRKIDHARFVFDFITFSEALDFEDELTVDSGTVFYLRNYPESNREGFISEFREVLKNKYDVIEIHTSYWKDTIVEELAKEAGIKRIIIHGHSTGITQITANNRNEEERLIYNHNKVKSRINKDIATDFWACSEASADWLYRPMIPDERIRIIHNTIDTNRFSFNKEIRKRARKEFGWENYYVFGFVGRLEPSKNLRFLLSAFDLARSEKNGIRLIIVGDGSEKKELEKYVHKLGLNTCVRFTGRKDDTSYYYQMMDCFLLPSIFEGFPIVLLEAQCSGLKCIISQGIPMEECLTDSIIRISISDVSAWKKAMLGVVNEYEREEFAELLKKRGFDTETQIVLIEELYEKV